MSEKKINSKRGRLDDYDTMDLRRPPSPELESLNCERDLSRPSSPDPELLGFIYSASSSSLSPVQAEPEIELSEEIERPPSPAPNELLVSAEVNESERPISPQQQEVNLPEPEFIYSNIDPDPSYLEKVSDFDEYYEEELKSLDDSYLLEEGMQPLYTGASITLHESLVSILTFAMRFSLSGQCIASLLALISLHTPKLNNILKNSLYHFKNYFSKIRGAVDYQYFCSQCLKECPSKTCSTCTDNPPLCYLIKMPVIEQLKAMYGKKNFASKLSFGTSSQGRSDVHSGGVYQSCVQKGIAGLVHNLTFLWYTDGAAVFNSSKLSVWPLILTINELPFEERFKKENILVPALWSGPVKPHGNILLKAVYPELQKLCSGVSVNACDQGECTVKGSILGGTADLPARGLMLNMVAHNGECACQKCYQKGECREGYFGVRVFPFRPEEMTPRSEKTFLEDGKWAAKLQGHYFGLKGPTLLSQLSLFPIRGTGLDSMHLIYGGCGKTMTKLILTEENKKLQCNIYDYRCNIDDRLLKIKPPAFLTRLPKTIAELSDWKTSLFKSWCLYFSIPVMHGILPELYHKHYCSFVAAVQLLNSEEISTTMLSTAGALLEKFVSYFEDLYGKEFMTLNFHHLLHLVNLVQELGALWTTSCFPLESINGVLVKMIHGTRFVERQIAASVNINLALPDIIDNLQESDAQKFCSVLMKTTATCKSTPVGNVLVIGKINSKVSVPKDFEERCSELGISEISTCYSIRKERVLYVAECHPTISSRDSSSVLYMEDCTLKTGIIQHFLINNNIVYAAIQRLEVVESFPTLLENVSVPNIHRYNKINEFILLPADALYDVCVKMIIDDKLYIAKRCNRLETE